MSDELKMPATMEQYIKDLRAAFETGASWYGHRREIGSDPLPAFTREAVSEARRRYPIRTKVQRRVFTEEGLEVRYRNGQAGIIPRLSGPIPYLTTADLEAIRDLIANPFEEVTE